MSIISASDNISIQASNEMQIGTRNWKCKEINLPQCDIFDPKAYMGSPERESELLLLLAVD
jgi:hypothetical protein